MKPHSVLGSLFALSLVVCAAPWSVSSGQDAEESGENDSEVVYELRTYTTHPGRLDALHKRFREHTMRLFEKHGMKNVIYWTPVDKENTLVYVLQHKSLEDAKRSWQAFREDPRWQEARAASEKDGPIVMKIESQYLKPTEYSPRK